MLSTTPSCTAYTCNYINRKIGCTVTNSLTSTKRKMKQFNVDVSLPANIMGFSWPSHSLTSFSLLRSKVTSMAQSCYYAISATSHYCTAVFMSWWPCTIEIAWVDLVHPDPGSYKKEMKRHSLMTMMMISRAVVDTLSSTVSRQSLFFDCRHDNFTVPTEFQLKVQYSVKNHWELRTTLSRQSDGCDLGGSTVDRQMSVATTALMIRVLARIEKVPVQNHGIHWAKIRNWWCEGEEVMNGGLSDVFHTFLIECYCRHLSPVLSPRCPHVTKRPL